MKNLAILLILGGIAVEAKYCKKLCDEDSASLLGRTLTASEHLNLHGRTLRLVISDADNVAYARIENGDPGDEIWLDKTIDTSGKTWDHRVGYTKVPPGSKEVNSPVFNIDNEKNMGAIRACGKAHDKPDIPCTPWRSTLICQKFCDNENSNAVAAKKLPFESVVFLSRKLSLFVSDADSIAYARIENGEPNDQVWMDRSFTGGSDWGGERVLGSKLIQHGGRSVNTDLLNVNSAFENRQLGIIRACGKTHSQSEVTCTRWIRNLVCGKYCDGEDSKLVSAVPNPSESEFAHGRRIQLLISDQENVAHGRIENAKPQDEVWLDRSYDGGHNRWGNEFMGRRIVHESANEVNTTLYNVDDPTTEGRHIGVVRACGKMQGEVTCTRWVRNLVCGKYCDGDDSGAVSLLPNPSESVSTELKVSLFVSDNVAYGRLENANAEDEIWLDRSHDGGVNWWGNEFMGRRKVPQGATGVNTSLFNIDAAVDGRTIGVVRACGKSHNSKETTCTRWIRNLVCGKYCDGDDSSQVSIRPSESIANHFGRRISLFVSDSGNIAYGRLDKAQTNDEIWLDRSFDGGHNRWGNEFLGRRQVPKNGNGVKTPMYNIDTTLEGKRIGVIRACAKPNGHSEIACTRWIRNLVCGKYCDGDDVKDVTKKKNPSESGKNYQGRKISLYTSEEDNVAYGRLENAKPKDEIWLDRSYDGGVNWWGNGNLGKMKVPKNAKEVNTSLYNVDSALPGRSFGVIRACVRVAEKEEEECTEWRRTFICGAFCDGDDSSLTANTRTATAAGISGRTISLIVSYTDNVTYGRLENGAPADAVWVDRSYNDGASFEGQANLGHSSVPKESRAVNTPLFNQKSKTKGRIFAAVRACGHVGSSAETTCTSWTKTKICSRYCDGDDSSSAKNSRKADVSETFGRKISLYISDSDNAAFATIGKGNPGDEVWLDRSWDGGDTVLSGSRLGFTTIPSGNREISTKLFNIDMNSDLSVVRACGKAGDRNSISCTDWHKALPRILICNKFCDGDNSSQVSSIRTANSVERSRSRISIILSDQDNVAYAMLENATPEDEVWVDRSWDGGRSWTDGNRLGNAIVGKGSKETKSSLVNIDGNFQSGHIGVVRACGNVGDVSVCTSWTRTQAHGKTPIEAAMTSLMMDYNEEGLWDTTNWWNAANCLITVIDYFKVTNDTTYNFAIAKTYRKNKDKFEGNFCSDSMADSGWWGLAWVAAYDVTGDRKYLDTAKIIADYMYQNRDKKCNGGIYASTARTTKTALANELYMQLAASIFNRLPKNDNSQYLRMAKEVWVWFKASGMVNNNVLVNEGLTESCQNDGGITWTHTQGVLIGALVELSRATGKKSYLDKAKDVADAVVNSSKLSPNGILHESGKISEIEASFKGIFARNLGELNVALAERPYTDYINKNGKEIFENRNSLNQYGIFYEGPFKHHTAASQHSALDMFIADQRS